MRCHDIGEVQPSRLYPHQHLPRLRNRLCDVANLQYFGASQTRNDDCFHNQKSIRDDAPNGPLEVLLDLCPMTFGLGFWHYVGFCPRYILARLSNWLARTGWATDRGGARFISHSWLRFKIVGFQIVEGPTRDVQTLLKFRQ